MDLEMDGYFYIPFLCKKKDLKDAWRFMHPNKNFLTFYLNIYKSYAINPSLRIYY